MAGKGKFHRLSHKQGKQNLGCENIFRFVGYFGPVWQVCHHASIKLWRKIALRLAIIVVSIKPGRSPAVMVLACPALSLVTALLQN